MSQIHHPISLWKDLNVIWIECLFEPHKRSCAEYQLPETTHILEHLSADVSTNFKATCTDKLELGQTRLLIILAPSVCSDVCL